MQKTDLTEYSDDELSLMVFNDEYLYNLRDKWDSLKSTIDEFFTYTDNQLETLVDDIFDDMV